MERTNFPTMFGEWVKQRRRVLDLTQKELAQQAGCSVSALRKIESGERRPSKQLARLLAESLKISSEDQLTFIRVARGDLNLERLHLPSFDSSSTESQPHSTPFSKRLPFQPTPLIGRDSELAAMEKLFTNPQCRLLTLTGMGGIGKTHLAIEFASRLSSSFPGGIYYVPLTSIKSTEAIVPGIAAAFELVFSGTGDPREELINYMAAQMTKAALLVLDNLEHLLAPSNPGGTIGAVDLVSELLQRVPSLRVLTTSRERLNLLGEWTYEIHGLEIPPQEFTGSLDNYSAAVLFTQSSHRAKADFEVTEEEQAAIIQICHLVEGVPLAIELAAAWVNILSCQEILKEIHSNIDFLTTTMHDVPERHRSLKATFEHSWKLLSTDERDVLSRLSVFHGRFDRSAAEKIGGASLPVLASLVSKSLVRHLEHGRYDLHEVVRQYALSHLDEDPQQCLLTCDLHSDYYLKFISTFEKSLKNAAQQEAMWEISSVLDDIRAAWRWAVKQQKYPKIGAALRSVGWYFEVAGLLREGIERLEPLIQALQAEARDDGLDRLLGTALLHQGLLHFRKGLFVRAEELYKDSIAMFRNTDDQARLADGLIFLGTLTHLNGNFLQAKELLSEGLEYAQASDAQWFVAYAIYNIGYVDSLMGEYQKGYEKMLIGLDKFRLVGDPHYIALGFNFIVPTLIKLGHYEEAKNYMWESISLCEQTKNRWGMGTAYRYLGLVIMTEGDYQEAQVHFRKSLEIFGEYTEGWDIAMSSLYLGEAAIMEDDITEARKYFFRALRISVDSQSIPIALDSLVGLAHLQVQAGRPEDALELSIYILVQPSISQDTRDRAIEVGNEARKILTDSQIKVIEEEAPKRTLQEIVRHFTLENMTGNSP
jgi:predicted ATPase/transcriptional regulator with XRE-family HTH domain